MVDDAFFIVGPHFLIIMAIFIEDPFEIRHSFASFDLFPDLTVHQHIPDHVLVVVAPSYDESQLVVGLHYP